MSDINPTDEELVEDYLSGKREAYDALVIRHTDSIFRFMDSFVHDSSIAEDLTQESFVKAWKHLKKFDTSKRFKAWLFTIARNTAFDYLRKKKSATFSSLVSSEGIEFEEMIPDTEPLPDTVFETKEQLKRFEMLLLKLPEGTSEAIRLHAVEGLTFNEIGDMLGISLNTVKSRYRRGLLSLKEMPEMHHFLIDNRI